MNHRNKGLVAGAEVRPWFRRIAILVVLLCAGVWVLTLRRGHQREDAHNPESPTQGVQPPSDLKQWPVKDAASSDRSGQPSGVQGGRSFPTRHPQPTLPEPGAESRELVGSLCRLNEDGQPLTAQQALEWKQKFQKLIDEGAGSVPAIVEFLKENKDVDFGSAAASLGYSSARRALFDALTQIGGPEATAGTLQILENTAEPREIALLAQNLEKLAPEEYRQEALQAARETLALAAEGKLQASDVSPLFEVLQQFGGAGAVAELQNAAKQWNYYATIALAQLPDGAGIPSLIEIAQGSTGAKGNALEMLAQVSSQYSEARSALLDLARANKINPNQWPYLTPLLAGDQYHYQDAVFDAPTLGGNKAPGDAAHVLFGNQHFYTAPALNGMTPDEMSQRMALIDDLAALTTEPAALQALHNSRELLRKRFPQTASVSP